MWRNREAHLRPEMLPADEEAEHLKHTSNEIEDYDAPETLEEGEDDLILGALKELSEAEEEKKDPTVTKDQNEHEKEHFYTLPEGTVLLSMPKHFQVFGWGRHMPGVEVVNYADVERSHADSKGLSDVDNKVQASSPWTKPTIDQYLTLPVGHFFVNRTRAMLLYPWGSGMASPRNTRGWGIISANSRPV